MWRWSLVLTIAIAMFWAIWYAIAGDVPFFTEIRLTPEIVWILPFAIARPWLDVIAMPVWAVIAAFLFGNKSSVFSGDLYVGLGFGLVFGLVAGLGAGLVAGLGAGLGFGLGLGLVGGLVVGL
ncbi:MAG: hypothetical protein AAB488_02090, partial [Patescibacteria group bacterium]